MRPTGCQPILLYDQAVDMRKSFEGLSALVEAAFPGKLLTGSLFLFLNRRRNLIKILAWEGDGFAIWYKRLEQGTFPDCFPGRRGTDPTAVCPAAGRDRPEALKSTIFFVGRGLLSFGKRVKSAIFSAC